MPDYTLGTMRAAIDSSCFPSGSSSTVQNTLINKVREIFYYTPEMENTGVIWKGTEIVMALTVFTNPNGCRVITLPRGVETLVGVYDGCENRIIQNQWFSFLRSSPQRGTYAIQDLGDGYCGVVDMPATGATLKLTTSVTEAAGKTMLVTGTDINGNKISETINIPTLAGASASSVNTYYSVTQVILSVTNGNILVQSVSGSSIVLFSLYQPGETIPNYRRYAINLIDTVTAVEGICKRRYELLVADNDPCEVSSVLAFESGLKAYGWFRNQDMDAYRDAVKESINYLNAELSRFQADTATGTVRQQRQVAAGSMRNLY